MPLIFNRLSHYQNKLKMTSWDYYVGFEREPKLKGLESFLKGKGYLRIGKTKKGIDYASEDELVDLFYSPKAAQVEPGEEPDWNAAGFNVVSDLMITTKENWEEADKITKLIVEKYDAIFYDPNGEEFLRKRDL